MPLNLNGYTAHIRCDSKELEAYDIQQEDEKTMTCWVASEEGKAFTIHWGDEAAETTMKVCAYVDGRQVLSRAHTAEAEQQCDGLYELGHIRDFLFSPLVLTDDESLVSSRGSEELGSIRITMRRVQRYIRTDKPHPGISATEIGAIHEKSKKAGVHAVSFGEIRKTTEVSKTSTPVGLESEPFAVFKFFYRPLDLLRANGVAPPLPRAEKGKKRSFNALEGSNNAGPSNKRARDEDAVKPEPDDEDEDADDDVVFLQEQLAMIQQRLADAQAARRTRTIVKREASPICVPSFVSDEIIDLT